MREYLETPPTVRYTFSYVSPDGQSTKLSYSTEDANTWCSAVEAFLSFMEIIYGYSIKDQVLYDAAHSTDLPTNRLVYTNWKPKKKEKKDYEE
jgi:hypothetical protein